MVVVNLECTKMWMNRTFLQFQMVASQALLRIEVNVALDNNGKRYLHARI